MDQRGSWRKLASVFGTPPLPMNRVSPSMGVLKARKVSAWGGNPRWGFQPRLYEVLPAIGAPPIYPRIPTQQGLRFVAAVGLAALDTPAL